MAHNALSQFLTIVLNSPLFYVGCLLLFVGYVFAATGRQMRRLQRGSFPTPLQSGQSPMQVQHQRGAQVHLTKHHSEAVACGHCGKLVNHVAVRHQTKAGQVLLCQSCSKHYGRAQRSARIS